MNGFQAIKRQLLPLLKGLPIVIGCFLLALFIARKVISYTPNTWQTIARIKLDDQKYGFSNNTLYSDFDVFSTENKVQAEAAVLKSPLLIGMALDSLDFTYALYRRGKMRNTMLYNDSPLLVKYDFVNTALFDKNYLIRVEKMGYKLLNDKEEVLTEANWGEGLLLEGGVLQFQKNTDLLQSRPIDLEGDYILHVFSRDGLINDISERLDVVEVDKEMPIIRVVYKDQHPQKVADLANALCKTYISDYVKTKSLAAQQTVDFIDKKLQEVQQELQKAEIKLEEYKAVKGVVNTRQETETGLRQLSSLQVQLINLEMNEKSVLELEEYISGGDYFKDRAINFGFGDLLMTELVKKLKLWQDERIDLLLKYTEESDEVKAVDSKIEELKKYIVEAIKRNKAEILTKRAEVQKSVELVSHQFDGLSTREKELRILEREFHLQEQVYNFLSQKKIEASIASSANLAFHRIIQAAAVPVKPVAPNATLITFVAGLLGLIVGIAFIYLRKYALARVSGRQDIERHSSLPLISLIRSGNAREDFITLIKSLQLKGQFESNTLICISSTIDGEGKTYVANHLAKELAQAGLKVALLRFHKEEENNDASLDGYLQGKFNSSGKLQILGQKLPTLLDFKEKVLSLKNDFEVTILDAPASAISMGGIEAMSIADLSLYLIRANKTSIDYLGHADRLAEEYSLKNLMLLLNGAHKASNHRGDFVGTRFRYPAFQTDWSLRLRNYLNIYLR